MKIMSWKEIGTPVGVEKVASSPRPGRLKRVMGSPKICLLRGHDDSERTGAGVGPR